MKTPNIEVVPYDSKWPEQFELQAAVIKNALGDNALAIHHVGSTSVSGLAAKPKIDMIAEVRDLNFSHDPLLNLGYTYRGGFSIPFRKSFTLRAKDLMVNLHVFERDDPEIELNLLFRDYLRNNPAARDEYATLKYELVKKDSSHQKNGAVYRGYTLDKYDFIQDVLKRSGFNQLRFVLCVHHKEWSAAKMFRQKYFFDKVSIQDPYTWTFDHPQHEHVVLYLGTEIIGYAHIQLWPDKRAAIRIIVIDEEKRNHNYGGKLLALCEEWLKYRGYKSIHTESSPVAVAFYRKHGYTEMPFNDPEGYEGGAEDTAMGKLL